MKSNKIPQKHIDNLNIIKRFMTNDYMLNNNLNYNSAKKIIGIWEKLPMYLQRSVNPYILNFCNNCINLVSSYEANIRFAKESAMQFRKCLEIINKVQNNEQDNS